MANKTINDVRINVKFDEYDNHIDNLVSKESLQISLGKIQKWKTDFHPVVWTGDADTVNNHTVFTDVPADAVFTDTTYIGGDGISITTVYDEYHAINVTPATTTAIGGVIIGEGINVTQDGTISVDIPDVPQYTAGEGISIKDTPTKTISIEQTEFVRGNINNDGSDDDITLYLRTNDFNIIIDPTYESITLNTKVLEQDESYIWKLFFYEENGTFISCTSDFHFDSEQVSIPNNACYLKIVMKRADDTIDNFYEEIEICNIILSGENIREISLKPATSETLGGIKVGDNLSIDENGVLSAHDDYDDSEVIRRLDQIEENYVIEPDHLILNVVE